MRTTFAVLATVLIVGMAGTTVFAAQYPNVLNLSAFAPQANYMSLPGYLRYRTYLQDGQWIRYGQAVHIVRQELGAAQYPTVATAAPFSAKAVVHQGLARAQYPNVLNLWPFSPNANYMSLPGYLRYRTYLRDGHWIRYGQAAHFVHQELGG